MGYSTVFGDSFNVEPPFSPEQVTYLQRFANTRRMARDPALALEMEDPSREAVGLPIGCECEYFVGGLGYAGQDRDASIVEYNRPPGEQPSLWCHWTSNDDGSVFLWDGAEKFYSYVEWLVYLDDRFFRPWGRQLCGAISWQGEDERDHGLIVAGAIGIHALRGVRAAADLTTF